MLYGYPITATSDNGVHDCVSAALHHIHASLAAGQDVPQWPEILPPEHRATFSSRPRLGQLLEGYTAAVSALSQRERDTVLAALVEQNQVALLLCRACDCSAVQQLPGSVQRPVCDLFEYAFGLLSAVGLREKHYRVSFDHAPAHVCPFCGVERFDAPGAPSHPLDHYLPKRRYPFAGANLRNLVPMGERCNSSYKGVTDILRRDDGSRRKAFDPYNQHTTVRIVLDGSQPFAGVNGRPRWQIEFDPASEEVETWNAVFHVRERYERDVLDQDFDRWLRDFGRWYRDPKRYGGATPDVIVALKDYAESLETNALDDCNFLRAAAFRMLYTHLQSDNPRLLALVRGCAQGT